MGMPCLLLTYTTFSFSVTSGIETAIPWTTVDYNSGPESWWDSGTPSQIVMPWVGPYLFTANVYWDEVAGGLRSAYLVKGTDVTDINTRVANQSHIAATNTESYLNNKVTQVIQTTQENEVYTVGVHSSGTVGALEAQWDHPAACASFVYLGTASHGSVIVNRQSIVRSNFW